eukprot:15470409-Alexandrium_andersonii.AAC.1
MPAPTIRGWRPRPRQRREPAAVRAHSKPPTPQPRLAARPTQGRRGEAMAGCPDLPRRDGSSPN